MKIVNLKNEKCDVRIDRSSVLGNPFKVGRDGNREEVIRKYREYLWNCICVVDELKRAMKEPERYRQLRVRMGGWSAYFVMLSKEHQFLHISKVEHGLV